MTPNKEDVYKIIKNIKIPVKVMIRCRGGNFIYDDNEISLMETDIDLFKYIGIKKVVLGALTNFNTIDIETTIRLVDKASPMEVTFHKAIDCTQDILGQIKILSKIKGIKSILTSGGAKTA